MRKYSIIVIFTLVFSLFAPLSVMAQSTPPVQELHGSLAQYQVDVYRINRLIKGQVLDAFMENNSGNLDPFLFLEPTNIDLAAQLASYNNAVNDLVKTSSMPLFDLPTIRDKYTLAWNDDGGPGYSAALNFIVPEDGDYYLLAAGSLSSTGLATSGGYRLLVGIDASQVLDGTAKPTGAVIAIQDQSVLNLQLVQELTGSISGDRPQRIIRLNDINRNDVLYVSVTTTSGDLKPVVILRDYGGKPVRAVNLNGTASTVSFQQAFASGGTNYTIDISAASVNNQITSGEFRLQVGLDAPGALTGQAQANTDNIFKLAIPVKIGFKLQQIVSIDQPNEIMNDVGTLKLEWTDPALAFNPDKCDCSTKTYIETDFNQFLNDVNGKWPDFTFFNQQGNRWIQNRFIELDSSGHVVYFERFTTNFQLNFNWTAFPFDRQDFYIYIDMLYPDDTYVFSPMENFNAIDPNHGEDEFVITAFDTEINSVISNRLLPTSRFTFHFSAPRHLDYYIFRIFVPVLLIITVSYITFFLKDYTRRIEIATGNLLLFIAFSFSLGDNYPRMGYLTFLDAIMAITFFINTLVVVLNVYFKYLENNDEREKADRLEAPFEYIYPLSYLVAFGLAALLFLR